MKPVKFDFGRGESVEFEMGGMKFVVATHAGEWFVHIKGENLSEKVKSPGWRIWDDHPR